MSLSPKYEPSTLPTLWFNMNNFLIFFTSIGFTLLTRWVYSRKSDPVLYNPVTITDRGMQTMMYPKLHPYRDLLNYSSLVMVAFTKYRHFVLKARSKCHFLLNMSHRIYPLYDSNECELYPYLLHIYWIYLVDMLSLLQEKVTLCYNPVIVYR